MVLEEDTIGGYGPIKHFVDYDPCPLLVQVFINFVDNGNLDGMGFAPFGKVRALGRRT